jgi:hypothetical protein
MALCGNCKQHHPTAQDVKACYSGRQTMVKAPGQSEFIPGPMPAFATEPATEKQINYAMSLIDQHNTDSLGVTTDWQIAETMMNVIDKKSVSKTEISDLINALKLCPIKTPPEDGLPAGKYAVESNEGIIQFWEIDKPTQGKWAGRVFINMLVGSPGSWRSLRQTPRVTRNEAMDKIKADPAAAARLFGIKTRTCGRCGSPLSNIRSRAAGYGKHCAELVGWPYPSKEEAVAILGERGEFFSDLVDDKDDECSPGQSCKSIDELCSKHQQQYQAKYGRASNE